MWSCVRNASEFSELLNRIAQRFVFKSSSGIWVQQYRFAWQGPAKLVFNFQRTEEFVGVQKRYRDSLVILVADAFNDPCLKINFLPDQRNRILRAKSRIA